MTQFLPTPHAPNPRMQCKRSYDVGTTKSRSTSAGSSRCSSGDSCEVRTPVPSVFPEDVREIPNYEYPGTFIFNHTLDDSLNEHSSPLYIKNTFIEAGSWQPSSFNGYCDIRQIQSCPPGVISAPPGLESENCDTTKLLQRAITTGSEAFAKALKVQVEPSNDSMWGSINMARSKLTSPGSSSSVNSGTNFFEVHTDAIPSYGEGENELPEYDYPMSTTLGEGSRFLHFDDFPAFVIKNTFIDTQMCQSSPNSCYEPRQIKSCPPSGIGAPQGLEEQDHEIGQMPHRAVSSGFPTTNATAAGKESLSHRETMVQACTSTRWPVNIPPPPPEPPVCALTLEQLIPNCDPPAPARDVRELGSSSTIGFKQVADSPVSISMPQRLAPPAPKQAQILRLSEAISEPTLGSPELPTVGSAMHYCGKCKPCAHAEKNNCTSGINCSFCHLCPVGELKRRQKAKKASYAQTKLAGIRAAT